uniref:Zinc finger protein 513 n=1 Tax=Triatoma infestans TaxID=30076 RepID=A0A161MEG6_TRIIF
MRIHTGEKPYKCSECNYSSVRSQNLKEHLRIHTGEKPYKCSECNYSCAINGRLKRHMRRHTAGKPYKGAQLYYIWTFEKSNEYISVATPAVQSLAFFNPTSK